MCARVPTIARNRLSRPKDPPRIAYRSQPRIMAFCVGNMLFSVWHDDKSDGIYIHRYKLCAGGVNRRQR